MSSPCDKFDFGKNGALQFLFICFYAISVLFSAYQVTSNSLKLPIRDKQTMAEGKLFSDKDTKNK